MKASCVILAAVAAMAASSNVVLKYSAENLVKGSEAAGAGADVLSLARHAMEVLALPAAVVPVEPLAVSADLFTHANGYGIVVVEGVDESVGVTKGDYAFQKTMNLFDASTAQLPELVSVLAQGMKGKNAKNTVICAGDSVCTAVDAKLTDEVAVSNAASIEASLWAALPELKEGDSADELVVRDLANMKLVVESIKTADQSAKGLFVASVSDLSALPATKKAAVHSAVASIVMDFQTALQERYTHAGVQVLSLSQKMQLDLNKISASVELSRRLSNVVGLAANATPGNSSSPVTPLTIENIAEYQIILWSSVILAVITFLAISVLCGMDANRDSLLYAKFLTDHSNRKND
ncbi:hypothetical protein ACHHYP_15396 [Achlya hypogyna]|uniref:Secreted protein n=1 Tax=Achlya hypogyna TaxID=1202772 RepID=A0A1V9YAV7_ACHHY|nr:hypothetical protein ACHHYP_15396 [Achlya hypogyna]